MTEPVTELDQRFSEPGADATGWPETEAVLESAEMAWISTVRSDGRPHVTPLVSVWLDGVAYFTTGPEEQKAVNLDENPHVVLTTGNDTWQKGLDVMVEGEARRVTEQSRLERLAQAWAEKWDGRWQFEPRDGVFHYGAERPSLVFEVVPRKILAFGRGGFSHTRHVFLQ
jgi:nitroimidazol reductase NimA-like FMN-containing flavoprotein (pyridoxamine 5'-phosphate oxidase superfamily)